jgi:hypothetical protein
MTKITQDLKRQIQQKIVFIRMLGVDDYPELEAALTMLESALDNIELEASDQTGRKKK